MTRRIGWLASTAICAALAALAIAFAPRATAAQETGSRVVGGLIVYLGMMPAEIVRGHSPAHSERSMHGGPSRGEHAYHIVVAAFDEKTSARLENLDVKATVRPPARPPSILSLEKMTIQGTLTYGGFFDLSGYGRYRISLHILRPGATTPVVAEFVYDHLQ